MRSHLFFFFNDTATTEIYTYRHTLSLHDALPISGAGHACGGGPAPRRRPGHRAPVVDHCPAAPLLAADAGDLAAAVAAVLGAVRAAPAQAGDAHAGAPALPRRVRFPRPASGGVGRTCRGHPVLARCTERSGPRHPRAPDRKSDV